MREASFHHIGALSDGKWHKIALHIFPHSHPKKTLAGLYVDAWSKTAANADRGIFPIFLKNFSGYRVPIWKEKWKDRQCNANLEGMDNYGAVHDREGTNLARSTKDTIAVDTVSALESVMESSDSSLGFMNEKKQTN